MSFGKPLERALWVATTLLGLAGEAAPQDPRDLGTLPFEGTATIAGILPRIDAGCILRHWRLKGVLACPTPQGGVRVCLWVENPWPTAILEVVRQPYVTHFAELQGPLRALRAAPLGTVGSSAHAPRAGDGTSLEYAEARLYSYVPDYGLSQSGLPLAIPTGAPFAVSYVSELDAWGWRSPAIDRLVDPGTMLVQYRSCSGPAKSPRLCAGPWGSYSPRVGFAVHPSQVMAAYLQALRAGRVASRPFGRVVAAPYPYEPRTGHFIQMLGPAPRPCVAIGFPFVRPIEAGAASRWGNYLFVHFGVFETCRGCLPVRLTPERAPV